MDNLEQMLRHTLGQVLDEKLQPVNDRLAALEEGQRRLEAGQEGLKDDVAIIRRELREVWRDILNLDNRLERQENKTNIR